jgi:hypothetical protein
VCFHQGQQLDRHTGTPQARSCRLQHGSSLLTEWFAQQHSGQLQRLMHSERLQQVLWRGCYYPRVQLAADLNCNRSWRPTFVLCWEALWQQ